VLREVGIPIDLAVGCSGGALYVAAVALGWDATRCEDATRKLWNREITARRDHRAAFAALFPKLLGFSPSWGLVDDRIAVRRVQQVFGELTFADAGIPLRIVATDFLTGDKVLLSEGRLADAMRASFGIPFVFRPWKVGDRLLCDGFLSDPLPVDVAIRERARLILAMGFAAPVQRHVTSPVRFAFQVTTVMSNNLLRANFAFHNLANHGELVTILPTFEEEVGPFETEKLSAIIAAGDRAMRAAMPAVESALAAP